MLKQILVGTILGASISLVSCGNETQFRGSQGATPNTADEDAALTQEEDIEQNKSVSAADVIFLVDTSGSMDEEKARLESNMEKFLNDFLVKKKDFDFQIFLVGTEFNFPSSVTSNKRVNLVPENVQSNDALDIATEFLNGNLTAPSLQLRPNANKELVVVTDDDAFGPGVETIRDSITSSTAARVRVNGFVGLDSSATTTNCNISAVGSTYIELARLSKKPGLLQDLCLDDWSVLMDNLGNAIVETLPVVVKIKQPVDVNKGLVVEVDGQRLLANEFVFDAASNSVTIEQKNANLSYQHVTIKYFAKPTAAS